MGWAAEVADIGHYLDSFGARTPEKLKAEQRRVAAALANAGAPARKVAAGQHTQPVDPSAA